MNRSMNPAATKPWYRQREPWLLMLGPFVVVVAGFVTAWLAVSTSDGLVADDYYKQGLQVGQTLARSGHAAELGLAAHVKVTAEMLSLRLVSSAAGFNPPGRLVVTVSHPTRAGLDQTRLLERADDRYSAAFRLPASGHWLITIEDEAVSWRLLGKVLLPAAGEVVIGDREPVASSGKNR